MGKNGKNTVRVVGLVALTSLLCIATVLFSVLSVDEFASKFILSAKVMKLHRLIIFLSAGQWLLVLALIYKVESNTAKRTKISN